MQKKDENTSYAGLRARSLTKDDIDDILDLQDAVYASLTDKSLLACNTREIYETQMDDAMKEDGFGVFLGIYNGKQLIALGSAVSDDGRKDSPVQVLLNDPDYADDEAVWAVYDMAMVLDGWRGMGLQQATVRVIERYAASCGITHFAATISPDNPYSASNARALGYRPVKQVTCYGGLTRDIYVKDLRPSAAAFENRTTREALSLIGQADPGAVDVIVSADRSFSADADAVQLAVSGDILEFRSPLGRKLYGILLVDPADTTELDADGKPENGIGPTSTDELSSKVVLYNVNTKHVEKVPLSWALRAYPLKRVLFDTRE